MDIRTPAKSRVGNFISTLNRFSREWILLLKLYYIYRKLNLIPGPGNLMIHIKYISDNNERNRESNEPARFESLNRFANTPMESRYSQHFEVCFQKLDMQRSGNLIYLITSALSVMPTK